MVVYKGAILGALVAGLLDVTLMAQANTIETVCLALFIPFFIGGLMNYNPSTKGIGLGYSVFFPYVVIWGNQARINELEYLNTSAAMVVGLRLCAFAFLLVAPYSPIKFRQQIRQRVLHDIQSLAKTSKLPNPRYWVLMTMEWFVYLMRQFNPVKETALVEQYNHGTIAVMSIGLSIMKIRKIIGHGLLPTDITSELQDVMRDIASLRKGQYEKFLTIIQTTLENVRVYEAGEKNLAKRLEIIAAIAHLVLIYHALKTNVNFFNSSN